jgi:hypothetical protein
MFAGVRDHRAETLWPSDVLVYIELIFSDTICVEWHSGLQP